MPKNTRIPGIRDASNKEQYTALLFLYYFQSLLEGSPPSKSWTREELLVLLNTIKGDDDVFDQRVVAGFDAMERLAEEIVDGHTEDS